MITELLFPQDLKSFWKNTSPFSEDKKQKLQKRWSELPKAIRSDSQIIGKTFMGCEGTQGIIPKCNFACKPCYHSKEANKVPVDPDHTLQEIEKQLSYLKQERGNHNNDCQLIGGEITLLGPQKHAEALLKMEQFGRNPMSFSHGDFSYSYLQKLVTHAKGKLNNLSFAIHIDSTMVGRRGIRKTNNELDLQPYRTITTKNFTRLRKEFGIKTFLAHNMTVTEENAEQIPSFLQNSKSLEFDLFSFQPAAQVGDKRRFTPLSAKMENDHGEFIWNQIEKGFGRKLPYQMLQSGDMRCNRTVWGLLVGDKYFPVFEQNSKIDKAARDSFLEMGERGFTIQEPRLNLKMALRFSRGIFSNLHWTRNFAFWFTRYIFRIGLFSLIFRKVRPLTIVMHRFMDADLVKKAYLLNLENKKSEDLKVLETQERLQGCMYSMAHPKEGKLVPACVQHSLLDPEINRNLAQELKR